jgi:hypothetical protein
VPVGKGLLCRNMCVSVSVCVYVLCGGRRGLLQGWLRLGGSGGRSLGCACGERIVVFRNM